MTERSHDAGWLSAALASDTETARPTPQCPAPERIWDAVGGRLPHSAITDLLDHVSSCPVCTEAWRLAHDVGPEPAVSTAQPASGSWQRWGALAAAATVVVAVGMYTIVHRRAQTDPSAYREGSQRVVRSLVSETQPISRERCLLRWSAGPDGSRYSVQVATRDLAVIARARDLTEPEFLVPPSALTRLPDGSTLLWQVEVSLPGGARQSSATFIVTLE